MSELAKAVMGMRVEAPPSSLFVAPPQAPAIQKEEKPNPAIEEQKRLYDGYLKQYVERLKLDRRQREQNRDEAVASGTLPQGSLIGTKYDPSSLRLLDGKGPATPEQFAKWKAGTKDISMGSGLWFPEEKELENAGFLQNLGAGIEEITYGLTRPMRKNLGLETETSPYRRMGQIESNSDTERRKKELKARIEKNEKLSREDAAWLAENDKGFFLSFAEGFASIPELVATLIKDPEERREFLNDMLAQLPASMLTSKGIGAVAGAAKNLHTAKKATETTAKSKKIQLAKDFVRDQVADAAVETVIEGGRGAGVDAGSVGRNLGEGFGLDGALQTGLGVAMKGIKKVVGDGGEPGGTTTENENANTEPRFHAASEADPPKNQANNQRSADLIPTTLSAFERPEFKALHGKNVNPEVIRQMLNKQGVKDIEKNIINEALRQHEGQKSVSFDEIEKESRTMITPLERIKSSSYATYGMDKIGFKFNPENAYTLIFNFPNVNHGEQGHFSGSFEGKKGVEYEVKQLNDDTWAAVEKGSRGRMNEGNVHEFVGTAGDKAHVEKWIEEQKSRDGIENKGLFGHIRVWESGDMMVVPELQSDYFQKHAAKKEFIENENPRQKEIKRLSDQRVTKVNNASATKNREMQIAADIHERFAQKHQDDIANFIMHSEDYEVVGNDEVRLLNKKTGNYLDAKGTVHFRDGIESIASTLLWLTQQGNGNRVNLDAVNYKDRDVANSKDFDSISDFLDTIKDEIANEKQEYRNHIDEIKQEYDNKVKLANNEYNENAINLPIAEFNEQEIYSKLPPESKQFIASQKTWERRLLHEAVQQAVRGGFKSILFPTPKTAALIEGYKNNADFDIKDLSDSERRVLDKYSEQEKQLKKDYGSENVRIREDRDGNEWIELNIDENVSRKPVVAYHALSQDLPTMESARLKIQEKQKETYKKLGEIWDNAMQLTPKTAKLPENNINIPLGRPSARLNKAIGNALNEDVKVTEQNITLGQVWHMDNKHGEGNERFSDQNPVTKETFLLVPDVLENFDSLAEGRRTWKDGKEHRSVLISKGYSDGTVILADAIIDGSKLEIKTMVLKKPTEVRPRNAVAPSGSLLSSSPADLTAPNEPALPSQETQSANNNIQNPKPIPKADLDKIVNNLNKNGLAVEVITDKDKFEGAISKQFATPDGTIYGYATTDGRIGLNPAKMNANTPMHEYGHLWLDFIKQNNKGLYNQIATLALQTNEFHQLIGNPAYKHLTAQQRAEEAIATIIGNKGEATFHNAPKGLQAKLKQLINELWQWIKAQFGHSSNIRSLTPEQVQNMTFEQLMEAATKDITAGKRIAEPPKGIGIPVPEKPNSRYTPTTADLERSEKDKIILNNAFNQAMQSKSNEWENATNTALTRQGRR